MKISKVLLPLLLVLSLLAGCGAPAETASAPAEGEAAATGGGQVVLIIPEEPATLNPYLADAAIVRQVSDATVVGLVTVDVDGNFVPKLAAELPTVENGGVSEDFLTVTWKLKPDLKWSDGEPITADDVKFTWEAVSNPDSGVLLETGAELVESIETPDDQTVVVKYTAVNQAYLNQFRFGIFPRHAIPADQPMKEWEYNRNPVSAGPFTVSEWTAGDSIVMSKNPNYYEAGLPHLDTLIFKVVPDISAQTAMMIQGEAQVHLWPGVTKEEYDQSVEGVASQAMVPGQWNLALRFNLSRPFDDDPSANDPHPILGDLRVRQALAHAIDYDTIINDIVKDAWPTTSPFAYGWFQCDIARKYEFDVTKANALLDEAGWPLGPDGVRVAQGALYAEDGTRLALQMEGYTNFPPLQQTQEALVEQFKAVGIESTIQNDDFSIIFGSYEDQSPRKVGNFDMLIYDDSLGIEPHATVVNLFSSAQIPTAENPAGGNYWRWVNADADAAIEAAGSTVDIDKRKEAYCQLGELIATDLPQIHILQFTEGYGAANNLTGYQVNLWGSLTWDVQNWQLQQ